MALNRVSHSGEQGTASPRENDSVPKSDIEKLNFVIVYGSKFQPEASASFKIKSSASEHELVRVELVVVSHGVLVVFKALVTVHSSQRHGLAYERQETHLTVYGFGGIMSRVL